MEHQHDGFSNPDIVTFETLLDSIPELKSLAAKWPAQTRPGHSLFFFFL